jgi:hypothetical protein
MRRISFIILLSIFVSAFTVPQDLATPNISDPSEQEWVFKFLVARSDQPGVHPLGVYTRRMLSSPLEEGSGEATFSFSDPIGSGRFVFSKAKEVGTYAFHPMSIRDAVIIISAKQTKNTLLKTSSKIFSGYMHPDCQPYVETTSLKITYDEKWIQEQFDKKDKWKEHVYLWEKGKFVLYYQNAMSDKGDLRLNEIGDREWFEYLRKRMSY